MVTGYIFYAGGGLAICSIQVLHWVSLETSNQLGPELLGIWLLMMKGGH
jgi:hypothetical protein